MDFLKSTDTPSSLRGVAFQLEVWTRFLKLAYMYRGFHESYLTFTFPNQMIIVW